MSELSAAPSGLSVGRRLVEVALGLAIALVVGLAVGLLGGMSAKYQVASMIAALLIAATVLYPSRRIMLLVMWVVIQPLSAEKVFYTGITIGAGFADQTIAINAADLLLVLLALTLLVEWRQTGRPTFLWSPVATVWAVMMVWATVSYAWHAVYLDDGLTSAAPLTLLHYARMLVFIVLVFSAVRSRGDIILLLLAITFMVSFESLMVGLSYVTGERFNLTKLMGAVPNLELQSFSSGEDTVKRATGTLGHTNQQAAFHTFYTIPLIALFALRNPFFRVVGLAAMFFSTAAIVLTFSRSAWLAYTFGLVLVFGIFLWRRMISPRAWMTGALTAVLCVLMLAALSQPILKRLTKGDDGATDSRIRMIVLALDLFAMHPIIGVGPGEFSEAGYRLEPEELKAPEWVPVGGKPLVPTIGRLEVVRLVMPDGKTFTSPLPVHNRYLLALSELGIPGLVLWLLLFWFFGRAAWRCAAADARFYRFLGVAGLGLMGAISIYMLLDLFADDKSTQVLTFCALIVLAASRHVEQGLAVQSAQPGERLTS